MPGRRFPPLVEIDAPLPLIVTVLAGPPLPPPPPFGANHPAPLPPGWPEPPSDWASTAGDMYPPLDCAVPSSTTLTVPAAPPVPPMPPLLPVPPAPACPPAASAHNPALELPLALFAWAPFASVTETL